MYIYIMKREYVCTYLYLYILYLNTDKAGRCVVVYLSNGVSALPLYLFFGKNNRIFTQYSIFLALL